MPQIGLQDPIALAAQYDPQGRCLIIKLNSGSEFSFRPQCIRGLEKSGPEDLENMALAQDGSSIFFPKLQVNICVPSLLDDAWTKVYY